MIRVSLLAVLLAFSACAEEKPAGTKVVVFAAASLREAFLLLEPEMHPGVRVTFHFAGSQELRTQIEHGARSDIFASADVYHMNELHRAGRVLVAEVFAKNEPVVVVSAEQVPTLLSFFDLPSARRIVVGAPSVPIGRYTQSILEKAGSEFRGRVRANVISEELHVRHVLAKISMGEADAGIVYRTDALSAADKVLVLPIPANLNVMAEYPIAILREAVNPLLAKSFFDLVLSERGQAILARSGFLAAKRNDG